LLAQISRCYRTKSLFTVAARGPKLRECCTTETKIKINMKLKGPFLLAQISRCYRTKSLFRLFIQIATAAWQRWSK